MDAVVGPGTAIAKGRPLRLAGGAAALAAYMGVVLFWVLQHPGGEPAARFIGLAHALPAFGAALVCLTLASRRSQESIWARVGWAALGLGSLAFAASQGAVTYDRLVSRLPTGFPALSDWFYLVAYPCLFVGIVSLASATDVSRRFWVLLDGLVSLSAVFALSWYFVLKPLLQIGPFQIVAVCLASPVLDLGILYAALILSRNREPGTHTIGQRLVAGGIGFVALTDMAYVYLTLNRGSSCVGVLDVGWAVGFALLATGAFAQPRRAAEQEAVAAAPHSQQAATEPWSPWSTLRVVVPVAATAAAALVLVWFDYRPRHTISFETIGVSFGLVMLTMSRQVFTLVESRQLHSNLHIFNHRLEEKVHERTHQLQTLHEIARAASSSLRLEEVLEQVLHRVGEALRAEAAAVWLVEERGEDAGDLRLCGQIGLDPAVHQSLLESIPSRWKNGLSELFRDRYSLPVPFVATNGARNADGTAPECLCAAIQCRGKVRGVLAALRWQERFGPTERSLLEAVALEIAGALQNAHLYDLAVRAADRDGVTNLLNHRAAVQRLEEECKRTERSGQPMAVMLLDLNNFKLFNDTHGHLVGDQVLKTTAALLNEASRATDVVGRYGGDEFILICPATDVDGARDLATRIQDRLAEATVQGMRGERLPLAGSIGLAVYRDGVASQHELLALADMNMYEAKAQGGPAIVTCEQTQEKQEEFKGGFSTLDALVTAVDKRDHYTRRHSEDVTEYSLMIAEELRLSEDTMRTLRFAGLLHDLGKIAIPDSILRKPGALTDEEYTVMKQHPVYGWLIVSAIPSLSETLPAVRHHHERFDGKGYPDNLQGEEIPLLGRLMAVADAFSAMTTDRPYRKGMLLEQALEQLHKGSGTQFDPTMVDAFLRALARRPRTTG